MYEKKMSKKLRQAVQYANETDSHGKAGNKPNSSKSDREHRKNS